ASDNTYFVATGVTDGQLLDGVRRKGPLIRTESLVLRSKTGTARRVIAEHRAEKWLEKEWARSWRGSLPAAPRARAAAGGLERMRDPHACAAGQTAAWASDVTWASTSRGAGRCSG